MNFSKASDAANNRNQTKINPYNTITELHMITFFKSLSEKDKRHYAATEALKLPHGGIMYISKLFGCDRKTICRGIEELRNPEQIVKDRVRKQGGGRKQSIECIPNIDEKFLSILLNYTAGDPMDDSIRWTHLSHQQIADRLKEDEGINVCRKIVKKLFKKHGYVKRKAEKSLSTGESADRNEQFEIIAKLKAQYQDSGNPIISVDTKKKEFIGNLYRDGKVYVKKVQKVYDHDFPHLADGIVIPHGIYDVTKNSAYVNIGISKDTSEFACDSIRQWWYAQGQYEYPDANSILLLCDAGGSNSYRHYIFKEDLQALVNEIDIEIRIAHYPSYASKWNPIEHKVFCHITRALSGVIFKSHEFVQKMIETTKTKPGLKVIANIIKKEYKTGRKVAKDFKKNMKIIFDDILGKWNYRAVPLAQR